MYFLISFIFTWGLGLLPAYLIRYKILRRPLKKRWAIPLAFIIWSIQLVVATYIAELAGLINSKHTALNLVAIVSFYILVKKNKSTMRKN